MSIDPRIIKSLLQLQLTPSVDFQAKSNPLDAASGNGSATLFDTLLSQYMSDLNAGNDSAAAVLPADALAQLSSLSSMTEFSYPESASTATGKSEYDSIIASASAKYGVDASLIQAVIQTESGFRADAVSSSGAKGLMQLMDGTARGLGVANSYDPAQNINGGTKYLAMLLSKYNGNEHVALAAYNAGPGRIDRLGIKTNEQLQANLDTLPGETQRYVGKVLQAR